MKKFLYIVLLLAVLIAIAYVLKNNQTTATAPETVAEEVTKDVSEEVVATANEAEENVVVVDEEPTSDGTADEVVAEDVVEENPEATADEGETVID